jgi:hypothetical protein
MSNNHYSASYDVDMAKEYGLEAAALYNKLVYLARYTAREDGFCWKTSKELENELGLSKFQISRAEKILVNAGLIETKVTYITGTVNRCKHYRVIDVTNSNSLLLESEETLLATESKETSLCIKSNHRSNHINGKFESEFSELWKMYPKKKDKAASLNAYTKARTNKKDPVEFEAIKNALTIFVEEVRGTDLKYIKNFSTWLNKKCWCDYEKEEQTEDGEYHWQ